jgi:dTDP-4-dehydrorhamnose reductase
MKVLLIGYQGQLGSDLRKAFDGEDLILTGQSELLVQNASQVDTFIGCHKPDLVLNCSAFHRVDDCEDHVDQAFAVNVVGVRNLAAAARKVNSMLVHFSTDYVFDGDRRTPYVETDLPSPKCIYGVSKAAGELMLQSIWSRHFLCRVSGLYGYAGSREKKTNFVEMMLSLARQGKPIRVVDDQTLTPTSTVDIAAAVRKLVKTQDYGLYHLTNAGECTWFEFANAIFEDGGLRPELSPVNSDAFPTKAKRPTYSVLDNLHYRSVFFEDMPHWRDALRRYLAGRNPAAAS